MKRFFCLMMSLVLMLCCSIGCIAESKEVLASELSVSEFEAYLKDEISEGCVLTETNSESDKLFIYPEDTPYIQVYTDDEAMIQRIVYQWTSDHENPEADIRYFNSLDYASFAYDVMNNESTVLRYFGVLNYINKSASMIYYLTEDNENNPYTNLFDARDNAITENGWEYIVATNSEEGRIEISFNYVGE